MMDNRKFAIEVDKFIYFRLKTYYFMLKEYHVML